MRTKQLKRFSTRVVARRRRNRQKVTKELRVAVVVTPHRLQLHQSQVMTVEAVARKSEAVHGHVHDRGGAAQEATIEIERRNVEIVRGVSTVKTVKLIQVMTPEVTTNDRRLCKKSLRKSERRRREMNTKVDRQGSWDSCEYFYPLTDF